MCGGEKKVCLFNASKKEDLYWHHQIASLDVGNSGK